MMHMHSTNYLTGQIYFLTCRSRDIHRLSIMDTVKRKG